MEWKAKTLYTKQQVQRMSREWEVAVDALIPNKQTPERIITLPDGCNFRYARITWGPINGVGVRLYAVEFSQ